MRNGLIFVILAAFCVDLSTQQESNTTESLRTRDGKALSVFQVVRFPNTLCVGSSSLNGTCYTTSECTNKGGTSAGSCASGFGVCCTFTLGCGSRIAENTTYFQSASTTVAGGQCGVTICKCSSDICQLRLDFNTFVITGPSTATGSVGAQVGGSTIQSADALATLAITQCLTDTFSVTGSPGGNPPVICGTNTGYHMYAEASDTCNTLDFQLNPTGVGSALATRQWNIRITQISCFDANKAPAGCVQYFYGATTGTLVSYNYAGTGSVQLANQKQTICIRRERSYCKTCYSETTNGATGDLRLSGMATAGLNAGSKCCGYGVTGMKTTGYDCLIIPGASAANNNAFCGGRLANAAISTKISATICTAQIPFKLDFISDSFTMSTATKFQGFKLAYWQTTC